MNPRKGMEEDLTRSGGSAASNSGRDRGVAARPGMAGDNLVFSPRESSASARPDLEAAQGTPEPGKEHGRRSRGGDDEPPQKAVQRLGGQGRGCLHPQEGAWDRQDGIAQDR